jgi:hypothetical protein
MNLFIVGNGASALNNYNGDFINTCDVVIRLGTYTIERYEKYIGYKTDVYVSRWFKSKNRSKEFFNTIKSLWIPRTYETREKKYDDLIDNYKIKHLIKYIPPELIFSYKARYPFRYIKKNVSRRGNDELYCCIPDSGIVAIDMARYFYPNHKIYISGFDNCITGYYWDVNNVLDNPGKDLLNLQLIYLKSLISNNIITDLSNVL